MMRNRNMYMNELDFSRYNNNLRVPRGRTLVVAKLLLVSVLVTRKQVPVVFGTH
jgi:hypothetical protein